MCSIIKQNRWQACRKCKALSFYTMPQMLRKTHHYTTKIIVALVKCQFVILTGKNL